MKSIIIGSKGFLGRHLLQAHRNIGPETLETSTLDLRRFCLDELPAGWKGCRWGIITAAVTDVSRCEQEKEETRRVNVEGTLRLAEALHQNGVTPVLFSSDYVFNGQTGNYSDEAEVDPINEYGKHKAELETKVQKICGSNYLIVRLSKVYGLEKGDKTLLDEIASSLVCGRPYRAARDQIFCPIWIGDAVKAILQLQKSNCRGLFNLCGPEKISRLELAQTIAKNLGLAPHIVEEISLSDLSQTLQRPKNTSMIASRLQSTLPLQWLPIQQAIGRIAGLYMQQQLTEKKAWDSTKELFGNHHVTFGDHWSYNFHGDPKRLGFVLSRYKFAAKMACKKGRVLELGCSDGIGATILAENAESYTGVDLDKPAVDAAKNNLAEPSYRFIHDDFMGKIYGKFSAAVSLDVIEHILPEFEEVFFQTLMDNLTEEGIAVVGTPNITADPYASTASKLGHVNLYSQERLSFEMKKRFHQVFSFGMNDEIAHTGFAQMCHYLICVGCHRR